MKCPELMNSIPEQRYLYRFDNLENLRKQRHGDPVLRGRRSSGNEEFFPHSQIREENNRIENGKAVYSLSFWKTWDDLLVNLYGHQTGCVVQRIPENHPELSKFKRDHDEYLKSFAWLYWNAMPINPNNPDWSPIGVPHKDIDVLHPNGKWMPMDQIQCLSVNPPDDWKAYYLNTYSSGQKLVHASKRYTRGHIWVMLWQRTAPLIFAVNLPQKLFTLVADDLSIPLESARWIHVVEHSDSIGAEEIIPSIHLPREPGLRGFINRLCKIHPPLEIIGSDNTKSLLPSETEMLYEVFGISEYLCRGDRWSNVHLLPPLEMIQKIRTKREFEFQKEQSERTVPVMESTSGL